MDEIRIGVFVCHCGTNIAGVIDCKTLAEYCKGLPNVVFTQDNLYTCSETGLSAIKTAIQKNNLNRVIVAACTPRTHEPLFRGICSDMGLNPYFFEFVNIREQCSWVHMQEHEAAHKKASELIKMGVARAALLEPLEKYRVDVTPSTLVIGGGIAGMTAALTIANAGYKVHLIEKKDKLGGLLNELHKLFPDNQPAEVLKITERITSHPNITVYTSTKINDIEGYIGNFEVDINKDNTDIQFKVGTVVIATGAGVLKPEGFYNYDGKTIITQLELEGMLKNGTLPKDLNNIIMIQCVGSRFEERRYCSNVCCMTALKNSLILKRKYPDANVAIIYRDIYTPRTYHEEFYRKVREEMVTFMRYDTKFPPVVENGKVTIYHPYYKEDLEMDYDLVVLSVPIVANKDSKKLSQMLKVPIEENGFFLEKHVKLNPVDFATDGIFLCGITKWPGNIGGVITQGNAVASHVLRIISKPQVEVEGSTANINQDVCVGCEICIKICPYGAITKEEGEDGKVFVRDVLCKGCGLCGATCPHLAIKIRHFTNEQINAEIKAFIESI